MARLYVGNLDPRVTERDLQDEFRRFGELRSVWVARKPPGFAFIDFEDQRDAEDAIRKLDGAHGWRVELSRRGERGGRRTGGFEGRPMGGRGGREMRCYECGDVGHLARDCRGRAGGRPFRKSYSRSPRRSPSYDRRSRSPVRSVSRSRSRSLSGGRSPSRGRSP